MRIRSRSCPPPKLSPFFEEDKITKISATKMDLIRLKFKNLQAIYTAIEFGFFKQRKVEPVGDK